MKTYSNAFDLNCRLSKLHIETGVQKKKSHGNFLNVLKDLNKSSA